MLTRWLGCIGGANLLLFAEWQDIDVVYRHDVAYFADGRFPLTFALSTALAVVVLGTALAAVFTALDRARVMLRPVAKDRLSVATTTVVAIVTWMSVTAVLFSPGLRVAVAIQIAIVGLGFLVRPPSSSLSRPGSRLFALTALLFPVFFGTACMRYLTYPVRVPRLVQRVDSSALSTGRVVWVVFDELDSTLAISDRPSNLQLPSFDRLRAESFEATQAYSPGRWTLDALPTLWTGRPVTEARESGPGDLLLTFADAPGEQSFDPSTSVFARAHGAGYGVGIAGWYHPYCRLFDALADPCLAVANDSSFFAVRRALVTIEGGTRAAVPRLIARHGPWSFDAVVAGGFTRTRHVAEDAFGRAMRVSTYTRIHERSLEMARDASLSLVFVHYPVPHLPGFFDRERNVIDSSLPQPYESNLVLMDRTIRELRAALEDAGLWNATTLVVHSDHGLRPALWKRLEMWNPALETATGGGQSSLTPFIVKMAGASTAETKYRGPFSAALTADIVLGALQGHLRTPSDLVSWLDANRNRVPLTWPVRTLEDR